VILLYSTTRFEDVHSVQLAQYY